MSMKIYDNNKHTRIVTKDLCFSGYIDTTHLLESENRIKSESIDTNDKLSAVKRFFDELHKFNDGTSYNAKFKLLNTVPGVFAISYMPYSNSPIVDMLDSDKLNISFEGNLRVENPISLGEFSESEVDYIEHFFNDMRKGGANVFYNFMLTENRASI